jgi:FkbM family methyltransferase
MLLKHLRQLIRKNRRAMPLRVTANVSEKFLRAWYNEAFFEFKDNGESFVARIFGQWIGNKPTTIWDVGANTGQWALEVKSIIPTAKIHCFEIIPTILSQLKSNVSIHKHILVHDFGLSDTQNTLIAHWNPEYDQTSSISPRFGSKYIQGPTTATTCRVNAADLVFESLGAPAFLKIDVEGHEPAVLRGAQKMLASSDGPVIIQVEYGDTFIPSGSTLKELYTLLEPHGFAIGRLYPNHVEFKNYSFSDDHFRMGNYIAVRHEGLKALLI